jgi:hypothetical protein
VVGFVDVRIGERGRREGKYRRVSVLHGE